MADPEGPSTAAVPRVAVLSLHSIRDEGKVLAAFLSDLRGLGYVHGININVDIHYADGDPCGTGWWTEQLARFAEELVMLKPNVALGLRRTLQAH